MLKNERWHAGEEEEDGYEDDYQLEDLELAAADYIKAEAVGNFRNAWEAANAETEMGDDYGLGVKDSLQASPLLLACSCRQMCIIPSKMRESRVVPP